MSTVGSDRFKGGISISVTVNDEGVICHSAGSPLSLPRLSHPPQWASDGGEPALHSPIRLDISLITEMDMHTRQKLDKVFRMEYVNVDNSYAHRFREGLDETEDKARGNWRVFLKVLNLQ
jgi:hypothetical protein